jgi:hypothetical protein
MKLFKVLSIGLVAATTIVTTFSSVEAVLLPHLNGGNFSSGIGISDGGLAVGVAADSDFMKGVKWDVTLNPIEVEVLDPLPGNNYSAAYGVNIDGIIVGESGALIDDVADSSTVAVYWQNNAPVMLPAPEGNVGTYAAYSINSGNLIVGESANDNEGGTVAVLWDNASDLANILNLHQADWEYSSAYYIHDDGIIVGEAKPVGQFAQGVIWTPLGDGYTVNLLPPFEDDIASVALGVGVPTINEMPSQVIGETRAEDGTVRGIVWTLNMQGTEINDVQVLTAQTSAQAINDFSTIVGYTEAATGNDRAASWSLDNLDSHISIANEVSQSYAINHANEVVGMQQGQALLASATVAFGQAAIGVFRSGTWYLDADSNGVWNPGTDHVFSFGLASDRPLVGDWTGNDVRQIAVFRNGVWYLDANGSGTWNPGIDTVYSFGQSGDLPVAGNWGGSNADRIGVFRNGTWYLDANGSGTWNPGTDTVYSFGQSGDLPVVGDWNGDGNDQIGVFRSGTWYLDMNGNGAWNPGEDAVLSFGQTGDLPVVGAWGGDGTHQIGVLRNGTWYLDQDGDRAWNAANDMVLRFGLTGDVPVAAGAW